MALNNFCSPDLSNDRRQNDVAGNRKINNDGVVFDAQHWAAFNSRAPQQAAVPSRLARAIRRSLSLTLFSIRIPVIWWS